MVCRSGTHRPSASWRRSSGPPCSSCRVAPGCARRSRIHHLGLFAHRREDTSRLGRKPPLHVKSQRGEAPHPAPLPAGRQSTTLTNHGIGVRSLRLMMGEHQAVASLGLSVSTHSARMVRTPMVHPPGPVMAFSAAALAHQPTASPQPHACRRQMNLAQRGPKTCLQTIPSCTRVLTQIGAARPMPRGPEHATDPATSRASLVPAAWVGPARGRRPFERGARGWLVGRVRPG